MASSQRDFTILDAADQDIAVVRSLFREFSESLNFDLGFQSFEAELAGLPGAYAAPHGCLMLARNGSRPAGCVALRPLETGVCEMKRMWVRTAYRRCGLGRQLAERVIQRARQLEYDYMRLDTIDTMTAAVTLYRSLGFCEIPAYTHNPIAGAVYMQLQL